MIYLFRRFFGFVSIKEDRVGGTIPKIMQEVRMYYQWCNSTNWLAEITSERESKLKDSRRKQDESVKCTESVHNIYLDRSGFLLGFKIIREP